MRGALMKQATMYFGNVDRDGPGARPTEKDLEKAKGLIGKFEIKPYPEDKDLYLYRT